MACFKPTVPLMPMKMLGSAEPTITIETFLPNSMCSTAYHGRLFGSCSVEVVEKENEVRVLLHRPRAPSLAVLL